MFEKYLPLLTKVAFDEDETYAIFRWIPFLLFFFFLVFFLVMEFLLGFSFFSWKYFRFLTIAVIAFLFVFVFGAFYIQDIYELVSPKTALGFMLRNGN